MVVIIPQADSRLNESIIGRNDIRSLQALFLLLILKNVKYFLYRVIQIQIQICFQLFLQAV